MGWHYQAVRRRTHITITATMPTALDRIQTLLQPATFAEVKTLAGAHNRTMSYMAASLIEYALSQPEIAQQIDEALIKYEAAPDPRGGIPMAQRFNRQTPRLTPAEATALKQYRGLE